MSVSTINAHTSLTKDGYESTEEYGIVKAYSSTSRCPSKHNNIVTTLLLGGSLSDEDGGTNLLQ